MKRGDFLQRWGLSSLKLNFGFMEGRFSPSEPDKAVAWGVCAELATLQPKLRHYAQAFAARAGVKM